MKPLQVMIGYDPKEAICYHVLAHSILSRASGPVSITPICLSTLRGIYTRPRDPRQSTDFTYARFLTPYLSNFHGISIFMDGDMLCLCDIFELVERAREDSSSDVLVVKHDYESTCKVKFLGAPQIPYPMKNWSSLMVFNGHRMPVKQLTPEYVNKASPMDLHQFKWAGVVGDLDPAYNHLVGEYPSRKDVKIVHYTLGAPCFRQYQSCEYAQEWFEELGRMTHCDDPVLEIYGAHIPGRTAAHSAGVLRPDGPGAGNPERNPDDNS